MSGRFPEYPNASFSSRDLVSRIHATECLLVDISILANPAALVKPLVELTHPRILLG